jgi:hypothetical protein
MKRHIRDEIEYIKRHTSADDFEMIAGKKCLKDQRTYRAGLTMMDAAPKTHLHDGHGNPVGHRPGFAIATNPTNVAQRQAAYDAYSRDLETAWRGDAVGEGKEGDSCTVKGAAYAAYIGSPGHIKNGVCVPDQLAADARPKADPEDDPDDEGDDDDNEVRDTRRRRRWTERDPAGRERGSLTEEDSRGVAQRMRDHQANMERIYQDQDYELTQAWRNPR